MGAAYLPAATGETAKMADSGAVVVRAGKMKAELAATEVAAATAVLVAVAALALAAKFSEVLVTAVLLAEMPPVTTVAAVPHSGAPFSVTVESLRLKIAPSRETR